MMSGAETSVGELLYGCFNEYCLTHTEIITSSWCLDFTEEKIEMKKC